MFQYEAIVDWADMKGASYTCPECQTVTTFSIDAPAESLKHAPARCAGIGLMAKLSMLLSKHDEKLMEKARKRLSEMKPASKRIQVECELSADTRQKLESLALGRPN